MSVPKPTRYNHSRYTFGSALENKLKPLLEQILGETLTKTREFYDMLDFESESYFVELKSRTKQYYPSDFNTWLLPVCKGEEANRKNHKKTFYFYYWSSTDEIYLLEYDNDLFNTFHQEIPYWHLEQQNHYWIPCSEWSLVVFEDEKDDCFH